MNKINNTPVSWRYFSDQVMGGISTGQLSIVKREGIHFHRLSGEVSTKNNGGFIQFRASISDLSKNTDGISLKVRGNGENYFVFIRTSGTFLPWQYYKASFPTTPEWKTIKIDLRKFERSSNFLRKKVLAESIRSIGIVAFGRDHNAFIDVSEVNFYSNIN
jgi:hypothetical protein